MSLQDAECAVQLQIMPTKWEYLVKRIIGGEVSIMFMLNVYGGVGWELIAREGEMYTFKRPRVDNAIPPADGCCNVAMHTA